ncbi:MAG: hypothetical protein JG767_1635 [Deferribacteraceae bacterium]|jgi:hypothetical protein|nr:hypothetical protein [Deferribacteraceae bacterium]
MLKRLILLLLFISNLAFAADEDYLVGLSAFEDGLYDVASESLEDFIASANDAEKVIYAKFILYRSYLLENKFEKALDTLSQIENINDKRLDKTLIKKDKIFILTKTDCEKAAIEANGKELIQIVINSKCNFSDDFAKKALDYKLENSELLNIFYKKVDNYNIAEKIFPKINLVDISNADKEYLAKYFYKNKNYDYFWDVYKVYKNDELVNLALSRLYEIENYDGFIKSFEFNKKYKLSKSNYCKLIKSYEKLGIKYDCALISKCVDKKEDEVRLTSACIIKNYDPKTYSDFIYSLKSSELKLLCEDIKNAISNDFYNKEILTKFKSCPDLRAAAKTMFKKGKYNEVIDLLTPGNVDEDFILISASYEKLGNSEKAKEYLDKIKDKSKFSN